MGQTTILRARSGTLEAEKIIGCKVENPQGENLGKVETLMIDMKEGRVAYAVLSFGGFLGMGEKLYPVPLNALSFNAEGEKFILNVDKETLKNAPNFDKGGWPDAGDRDWNSRVYSHYGYTPYW